MDARVLEAMKGFLSALDLDEEPLGLFFTDVEPAEGYSPKPMDLPTREREEQNAIDWPRVFGNFSCVMGNIWRARRKKTAAYFSAERFGCPGGAFWLGFMKPQTETIIRYVSTGTPGWSEGERYCGSPDELRRVFEGIDPEPATAKYCVVKPLSLFGEGEEPLLVLFFSRPEALCGLHQLAFFVTGDPEVVASPWGASCTSIATWPRRYLALGQNRAVVGGWDPSARKFFMGDELSFTVPFGMFQQMLDRYGESFLVGKTWDSVRKKIARSRKVWGKGE
jgi:uncharacterized protein (DUF169 family)